MTAQRPSPLRILVVAARAPWPLNHGSNLRLFNFLKGLSRRAAVTLALPESAERLEQLPAAVRIESMGRVPRGPSPRCAHRLTLVTRLARRHFGFEWDIEAWLAQHGRPGLFDAALLYGPLMGLYVHALSIPAVWDVIDELVLYNVRDLVARGPREWLHAVRSAALYALFEGQAARRAAATLFTSRVDASYCRRWAGSARIESISNGVDSGYFQPPPQAGEPGTVVFVGALDFPPNVDAMVHFARTIWPQIHAGGSARRLLIVGRDPVERVRALAATPGIAVHADVPDVRPYLARAAVVVVPTRLGGGVKNKVLEACAMRRPVLASPQALGGLSARRGVEVLCATRPENWKRKLERLLGQPSLAARVAENGWAWVRRAHDWAVLSAKLSRLLAEVAGHPDSETYEEIRRCPRAWNAVRTPRSPAASAGSHAQSPTVCTVP